jgi:hypothetical protein
MKKLLFFGLLLSGLSSQVCFGQQSLASTQLYDDSFMEAAHLNFKSFVSKYKPTLLSRQKETNIHDATQHDYVLTYQFGTDRFVFYQAADKTLITSFTCASPRIVLAKGIRIGMSQAVFERTFHHKVAGTTATVGDVEAFEKYTFTFRQKVLVNIGYQCRLD